MDFRHKNVLITGGSRGIGKAVAMAFAAQGARVAINFRDNNEAAAQTVAQLEGEDHFAVKADITHPTAVKHMLETVVKEFGRLDILVNAAGVYLAHPLDDVTYEAWQSAWKYTLDVNLNGAANVSYCAAQYMIRQGGGRIINISSRGAFRGEPNHPAYAASKAGLNALSQSLAQALGKHKIYVFAIAPGFVETDMARDILDGPLGDDIRRQSPLARVAHPAEVAYAVLYFASEGAEFSTGAILDINGASYLRT